MKLLVGYVVHEVTADLEECMCLSLTSLHACTDPDKTDVVVFCRPEVACALPQLGVNVCVVTSDITLVHGAASHQIVTDHGGTALFLLEPTTLVLKDMGRDANEMRSLKVSGVPYDEVGYDVPVVNCLTPDTPQKRTTIDRETLPLLVTPSVDFGKRESVQRWICGYSYSFSEGGWNAVKGSCPGLCITRRASEMIRAMRAFQCQMPGPVPIRVVPTASGQTQAKKLRYYAVLLHSRAERVAIVEDMRKGLPDGSLTVVPAVEGNVELDAARLSTLTLSGFLSPPYFDTYVPYRPILVNTVASFMSHVRAIQNLVEDMENENDPDAVGVIIEDDIRFLGPEGEFNSKVVDTCRSVWWENPSPQKPDVVQMFVMPTQRVFVNPIVLYGHGRMKHDEHFVKPSPESNWGMQCYMMRLEGAKKLLEGFETMKGAADEQISRIPGLDLRCLVGRPIIEEDTTSAPSVTQSGAPRFVKDVVY